MNFHGESRRNDTHQSTTDPDAQLARKGPGKEAKLSYAGHVLLDNRHGLVANVCVTPATGTAEREAAHLLLDASAPPGSTVGGDKGFDMQSFVTAVRALAITPHIAQKVHSAIDGRTTRHAGYAISQRKRKLIEQVFGWMKSVGGLRKLRHRGGELVDWIVTFAAAAYNLIRLRTLLARATGPRQAAASALRLGTRRSGTLTDGHLRLGNWKCCHTHFFIALLVACILGITTGPLRCRGPKIAVEDSL